MLPLRDSNPTVRAPIVTVAIIVADFAVWIGYELQTGLAASVDELGYHPCEVDSSCGQIGSDWPVTAFTSMFMHGSWAHIIGNMLFLWIFGNNIEDALGHIRFALFYVLGGLAATASQTAVTLGWGSTEDALIPNVGASGAIAAVLGGYILLYPRARVLTWVAPFFLFELPSIAYLGIWFLFQLWAGSASFTTPEAGGGVAYFAHIGGFAFGFALIKLFTSRRPGRPWPSPA
ncbi:MAG TPA: rhomboid family intramembrane serine protease [Gaiellaceae bacterium]|nr:rhomboid family intramembrane serine protease [Gaiellaceae bacterium]